MCNCIEESNKRLETVNTVLDIPFRINFTTGKQLPPCVLLATYKIDSKKHGLVRKILADYCPFCGEKYDAPPGVEVVPDKRTETLAWFTEQMRVKLEANAHKGDNWDEMGFVWLFRRLGEERDELATALIHRDLHSIIKEAADVANYAMMIADTARQIAAGEVVE